MHMDNVIHRKFRCLHVGSGRMASDPKVEEQRTFVASCENGLDFIGLLELVVMGGFYFRVFQIIENLHPNY